MRDGFHPIIFGKGAQPVLHIPPVYVASATYAIEDLSRSEGASDRFIVAAGTAATVDATSTTTTAVAGRGQVDATRLSVNAIGGFVVGRTYAVQNTGDGLTVLFRLEAIGASYLIAKTPFTSAFASGSTVRGVQMEATFPQASADNMQFVDDERTFRATWTYTLNGLPVRPWENIEVRRGSPEERYLADAELAIREAWPELVGQIGPRTNALRDFVRFAQRRLCAMLRQKNVDPDEFLAGAQGLEILIARTILHLADQGHAPKTRNVEDWRTDAAREFRTLWDNLTVGRAGHGVVDVPREDDQATAPSSRELRCPIRLA